MTSIDSNYTPRDNVRDAKRPGESEEVELKEIGKEQQVASHLSRQESNSASDFKEGGSASAQGSRSNARRNNGKKKGGGRRDNGGGGMKTPGGTPGMNDLNDIDEREQGDDEDDENDVDDIMQTKGMSEVNIMMRGADGIMNRDDQLKYKKILEKSKMQNHKPTKEHLMFGVIPNWDPSWTWTADAQES